MGKYGNCQESWSSRSTACLPLLKRKQLDKNPQTGHFINDEIIYQPETVFKTGTLTDLPEYSGVRLTHRRPRKMVNNFTRGMRRRHDELQAWQCYQSF
jgi:hypothetical protein